MPGGTHTVTADADGTARVSVSKLPANRVYTAWVDGVWTTGPWEEPPFAPTPAKLAATGVDGVAALVTGAVVLLGLGGGALLIARRRRRGGARDLN
ncbi:LPXTG cell wall anchor domain-containing protein [Agromyces sp. H66]|uniref:LPXTG cell wall anchor domain-containing protein n=1 Tax=Agromyces sp. H66 TaxID=2529859 RepID=UPI0010AB0E3A|nr:LPXTG cell wall anchor domain-containing protein [Agromyces sp. H66]